MTTTIFDDVTPWPETTPAPATPDRLHNQPPLEERIQMEFREALLTDRPEFLQVCENLLGAVPRVHVEDDETLGKAGNMQKRLRAARDHITAVHKVVKQPYLDGGRAADAEKNRLIDQVEGGMKSVQRVMDAYAAKREAEQRAERERIAAEQRAAAEAAMRAERERQDAEAAAARAMAEATSKREINAAQKRADEAARKAEEAMAQAAYAPAAPARTEPVRSDEGATVSGRQVWNSEVTDYLVAYMAVSSNEKVREAIDKAIAGLVRAGTRDIEGVRIWPTTQAIAR